MKNKKIKIEYETKRKVKNQSKLKTDENKRSLSYKNPKILLLDEYEKNTNIQENPIVLPTNLKEIVSSHEIGMSSNYFDETKLTKEVIDELKSKEYLTTNLKSRTFIDQWKLIEKMRISEVAPVDTMGVKACFEELIPLPLKKYQMLIALLLSSQTRDPITFNVMNNLITHGLTPENINLTSEERIKQLIYGVSFYNNKAKQIKKLTNIVIEDFNSDPPETYQEVTTLPGIGPKMGYLYLQCCLNKNEGIAVDTHVHRISNRLDWAVNSLNPESTRIQLQKWLPKQLWREINPLLVGFGQTICKAVKPSCSSCLINNTCKFGISLLQLHKKKSVSKLKISNTILKSFREQTRNIKPKRKASVKIKRHKANI